MKGRKKKIRRNPGQPRNMYFNAGTQAAIVRYQDMVDPDLRRDLYAQEILPAFAKLSENLIFVYGFKSPYFLFDELAADCVTFLYESIHKWDEARGTKAFSYFNVVAKNWLIINCRQHKKIRGRHVSIDDPNGMSALQKHDFENYDIAPAPDVVIAKRNQRGRVLKLLDDMRVKLTNENELICLQAIETLFANIDELELLNKRAVLIYIREISNLDKKHVSKALSSIRKHYREMSGSADAYDIFF